MQLSHFLENMYLQVSDGLLVTLNDKQFGSQAPEVHVIYHVGPLSCDLIHRLRNNHSHKEAMSSIYMILKNT